MLTGTVCYSRASWRNAPLLRNAEHDVAVTLEDCRELAEAEGLTDAWAIAERYAAAMLPAVFRIDDPVLALNLDAVHTQKLHRLVTALDSEVFEAEDGLGWTYQFWRAAEKDAVNKSGVKIGAEELPAVTQLFTEPYMVRFLLHNTLGAWWAGKVLAANPTLSSSAADEEALRTACSPPGYSFDMLRFVRNGDQGLWKAAAGTFPGWPQDTKAITVLDPCCGSGHFLNEALTILTALRRAEESLSAAECCCGGTARQSVWTRDRWTVRPNCSFCSRYHGLAHRRLAESSYATHSLGRGATSVAKA